MLKNMTIDSVTDKDGKLSLDVGVADAPVHILLTINSKESQEDLREWNDFVDRTEAKIDDPSFQRHSFGVTEDFPSFDEDE